MSQALNAPQREAIAHAEGPLLILAGAGSGKTRVITHRIAALLERGVRPWRILAVTFTNKAAGEMRQRTAQLVDDEAARRLWVGTFHATAARLLRIYAEAAELRPDFVICDEDDQKRLMTRVVRDLQIEERMAAPRALLSEISRTKNQGIGPEGYRGEDFFTDLVARVFVEYQRRLRAANALDFDDLLLELLRLCLRPAVETDLAERFDHVLVDEFQDTNRVQYQIVRYLSSRSHNLCVVGDDDQSIYRWRGADVRNILDFEHDHPACHVIKLEQNYRSNANILAAANAVIARNTRRKQKRLFTEIAGGEPLLYHTARDERGEALFVAQAIRSLEVGEGRALDEFAVFYRTHAQSRVLEEALRAADMPYTIVGGIRFYDRAEVKDLLAYLRVLGNPRDDISLERIINVPARGIGDATVEKIRALARHEGIPLWDALHQAPARESLLSTGPRRKVSELVALLDELAAHATADPPALLAERVLDRSGYLEVLGRENNAESRDRLENLTQLVSSMREYEREVEAPSLVEYLERVALVAPADQNVRGVALMTVHAAKGLEFPVVFVTGLEEGTFPRVGWDTKQEELEEERRLAYVAITRARERLLLTNAARRQRWSDIPNTVRTPPLDPSDPGGLLESRFISDIPAALLARPRPVARRAPLASSAPPRRRPRDADASLYPDDTPVLRHSRHPVAIEDRGDGVVVERDGEPMPYDEGDSLPRRPPKAPASRERSHALSSLTTTPAAPDSGAPLHCGQRVRHKTLGEGSVLALSGSGTQLKATVQFPEGLRTIVARFLEPA